MKYYIFCLFLLLPIFAEASVSISEIAWMGSADSANHEWIELHNDGVATDVTGWVLKDGANFNITLSGTIPANTYAVLERTSDDTVSGPAFLIYTGALVNGGATLRLEQANGSLVDMVSGGENWENIGGDNTTKETAQYTTSGWKTAAATPGRGLVWQAEANDDNMEVTQLADSSDEDSKEEEKVEAKKSSGDGPAVPLVLPGVTLQLDIRSRGVGYVNQAIDFSVEPSGIGDSLIDSLRYQWNFGDGLVTTGKEVEHTFKYPGTYVVTVHGAYKRQEQVARHEITILPVRLSMTTNREGDIQINNDSKYELDISGYRLRGDETLTFPSYSIILPNQTITIAKERLGKSGEQMVAIYDATSELVTSNLGSQFAVVEAVVEELAPQIAEASTLPFANEPVSYREPSQFSFADNAEPENSLPTLEEAVEEVTESLAGSDFVTASSLLASAGDADGNQNARFEYLVMAGVLGLSMLGVYAVPKSKKV
jgi:hypothetical protein